MKTDRRGFLVGAGAVAAVGKVGWRRAEGAAAAAPGRPPVVMNVTDYGAVGDGVTKNTAALQGTIDRCGVFGGGMVVVPEGTFLTGGILLRPGVTLRLAKGAVLKGSPDLADYRIGQVRWEGRWILGYLGLISARDTAAIAIRAGDDPGGA